MLWLRAGAGWNGTGNALAEPLGENVTGILYGNTGQLGAQFLGCLTLVTVMFGIAYAFFKIHDKVAKGGIRSSEADEVAGLDRPEMGVLAYPEFTGAELDTAEVAASNGHRRTAQPVKAGASMKPPDESPES